MKKVSIITINYNNREGLQKTIESVINQTFSDYEYIIIDGGSTDGSVDIIKKYADKIDYWISEPDRGIYHAMNKGILKAHGEYCNFLNSGDIFHNNYVLNDVFLDNYTVDIISGITIEDNTKKPILQFHKGAISMQTFYYASIGHQSAFIKRTLFDKYLYDENLKIVSDWKFYIQTLIFENCSFQETNIIVAEMDTNGISKTHEQLNQKEREVILKKLLPERILSDYKKFNQGYSPILELIPQLNKTHHFHQFIYHFIVCMIKVYEFIKPSIKR